MLTRNPEVTAIHAPSPACCKTAKVAAFTQKVLRLGPNSSPICGIMQDSKAFLAAWKKVKLLSQP